MTNPIPLTASERAEIAARLAPIQQELIPIARSNGHDLMVVGAQRDIYQWATKHAPTDLARLLEDNEALRAALGHLLARYCWGLNESAIERDEAVQQARRALGKGQP